MSELPGWASPADPTGDPLPAGPAAPTPAVSGQPVAASAGGWGAAPPPMNNGTAWGGPPSAPRPGVVPLRPLGVGEILDASINYIRRNPRATLGLAAVVAVVNGALQLIVLGLILSNTPSLTAPSIGSSSTTTDSTGIALNAIQVIQGAFSVFLQLIATGMLTFVMSQAVLGRSVTAREGWTRVKPLMWRLLGTALLTGVFVVGAVLVCLLPGVLLLVSGANAAGIVLLVIGVPAAVAVGVWLYISLTLAPAALVLERIRVLAALKRSRNLVRGAFWRILGITLLASILANIIGGIITIPFTLLGGLGSLGLGVGSNTIFASAVFGATLGAAVSSVITLPFAAGVTSLLYIDRRMRREGLDLSLARAAGVAAPTTPAPDSTPPGTQLW